MAADLCRDALLDHPRDDKMRVLLGTVLVRQNKFDQAESELRDVISRFPDIPKAHRELGISGKREMTSRNSDSA